MKRFEIIACDLDGTLLDSTSEISDANLRAIDELARIGVYFVPCTGRTFSELPSALKNNTSIRYVIHSDGAVIRNMATGERTLNCMSAKTASEVFKTVALFDTNVSIRADGEFYLKTRDITPEMTEHYHFWEKAIEVMQNLGISRADFDTFKYSLDAIETISIFFHDNDELERCQKLLEAIDGVSTTSACAYNVEVYSSSAGKGSSLLHLADMLGINRSCTAAMGDSCNDISMITAAGTGMAMANACDELKAVCDEIICSNDEDAVNYVLAKHFNESSVI
ncbi:MAG: Cof-type HAD-IIB family hydrolase [Clostridia bacterium]|nr:Cof-type HAD-IIB family hydrolase [Clostridia bacterium]